MKTGSALQNMILASLVIAGLNITTSCDSCSRKEKTDDNPTHTEGATTTNDMSGENIDDHGTTNGIDATGTGAGRSSGGNGSTTGSSASSSTSTSNSSATSTEKKRLTEEEITDRVENSSSTVRDANGKPVNSGGTSGSGSGTGTGSTGNNSRVSKAEDQKN